MLIRLLTTGERKIDRAYAYRVTNYLTAQEMTDFGDLVNFSVSTIDCKDNAPYMAKLFHIIKTMIQTSKFDLPAFDELDGLHTPKNALTLPNRDAAHLDTIYNMCVYLGLEKVASMVAPYELASRHAQTQELHYLRQLLDLHRRMPTAAAENAENEMRAVKALQVWGRREWGHMLTDLEEIAPLDATSGADRVSRTLPRQKAPVNASDTVLFPLNSERGVFADGTPALTAYNTMVDRVPADILYLLQKHPVMFDESTWEITTGGIVAAGGSPAHWVAYDPQGSPHDVDIFVVAKDAVEAQTLLQSVHDTLKPRSVKVSGNAVTMKMSDGQAEVQVVLRVYANPAMVIIGFDLQASKIVVFHDGKRLRFMAAPTGVEAMRYKCNWTSAICQSPSYFARLEKYLSLKHYSTVVPGFRSESALLCALLDHAVPVGITMHLANRVAQTAVRGRPAAVPRAVSDYHSGIGDSDYHSGIIVYIFYRDAIIDRFNRAFHRRPAHRPLIPIMNWMTHGAMSQRQTGLGGFSNTVHQIHAPFIPGNLYFI